MIYFARHPGGPRHGPLVKVGWTERMPRRLPRLAVLVDDEPAEVELLGVMDGGEQVEKKLHRQFAHLRLVLPAEPGVRRARFASEWFRPGEDLLGYVEANARPYEPPDLDPDEQAALAAARPVKVEVPAAVAALARKAARRRGLTVGDYLAGVIRAAEVELE